MPTAIDFYFDFISPYSYLASVELARLARTQAATITYRPIMLIELMKQVGNRPTTLECANKGAYVMADIARWAKRYQIKLTPPNWQTIDFPEIGRITLAAVEAGHGAACVEALFAAIWRDAADVSQRPVLSRVLDAAGLDGAALLARAPALAARLVDDTAAAATRGVFGSPTMVVAGEMFFGNDRFDFLTAALAAA